MFDLIIRNGTVIDGTGRPRFSADVGVKDGRITAVDTLADARGAEEIDATGFIVSPGFIDVHSHSDFTLLVDPRAQSAIAQGVTTELVGNCGHGCAPILDIDAAKANIYGYDSTVDVTWSTMAGYLELLECKKPAVNVMTLVPNGMLRLAAMDNVDRPATADEVREMGRYLRDGLEAGAAGFSVGLEYPTERASTTEELIELCRLMAKYDGLFAPHLRNREVRALEAIEEGLRIAEETGVRLHVPHVTPRRGGPPDVDIRALELVNDARVAGIDVSVDMHTRLHGLTHLSVALPAWAYEGGSRKLRQRLRDPASRAQFIEYESLITSFALGGWEYITLLKSPSLKYLVGKDFLEIADELDTTPFDAVLDILREEADDPHAVLVLCESYTEQQLQRVYQHAQGMVASDATTLCVDGPLSAHVFHGAFTWASWFYRRFVREKHTFTLEEAIEKLSTVPAARIGLTDRGTVKPGNWADLVVFDTDTFGERGTLHAPNRLAQGVQYVVVNGVIEMAGERFTGHRGGRVLRR